MTAAIISHGEIEDLEFHKGIVEECDLVICADGGVIYAKKMGIAPDVIVGDFDSCDIEFVRSFEGAEIIKFPSEKDKTDTELAVDYAIERGQKHILLLGSTGSRLDHTLANIGLLKTMLDRGVKGEIVNEKNRAFIVEERAKLRAKGHYISLIPFAGDVSGITLRGFKYPLRDGTLRMGSSLGISNELVEEEGEIIVKKGFLLVVVARD